MENLDKVYASRILEEYTPKTSSNVIKLQELDQKVKRPANIVAYTFGIISTLITGAGMSMILVDLSRIISPILFIFGISLGLVGLIMCSITPLIYEEILKIRKEKYAGSINELAKKIVID